MFKVLVVDDDQDLRLSVASALAESHYSVDQAADGEEAVNRVRAGKYDLVLMDVNMPKLTGIEALKEIKGFDPSIIVIILTAFSNVRDAVASTKEGAYNYLEKPIKAENLVYMVDRALKAHNMVKNITLSAPVFKLPNGTDFIGQSNEMKKVFSVIDKLSRVDTAVLIRGESGTGKELVAQALHFNSPRKDNRFVTINCSAIPENLIESEFFGHEKGSFTGADARKIGKFQFADGGTLFLDEIGDISQAMQVKLLRALQEKKFSPIGSNREVEVNVRIVAATNRNLEEMIKKSEFREDLFYRLNVLPIQLPPLRARKNDIEHLTEYFIEKFNQQHKKAITGLNAEAIALLRQYNWPGNIRELENVIEHAFVIESENLITPDSLPMTLLSQPKLEAGGVEGLMQADQSHGARVNSAVLQYGERESSHKAIASKAMQAQKEVELSETVSHPLNFRETNSNIEDETLSGDTIAISTQPINGSKLDFQASKEEFEKQFLISALKTFKGRINQTALHANIPKKTLLRKLEKYGITARDYA